MPYLRPNDLQDLMGKDYDPKLAENWISISEDVEFLPLLNNDKRKKQKKKIRKTRSLEEEGGEGDTTGAWADYDPYSVQPFVEGMSEYDEYQQAWRLLGFVIDCNLVQDDDYQSSHHSSGDEVTEEGCARYVLWAAYVDLEYEGGGIGEYQYWDRTTQKWNDTSCEYADARSGGSGGSQDGDGDGGSRCAKMDCHLEDTHFSVLGFFKHRSYDDWMEQLFKHEGMCVWTEEEYAFMKNARKAWPQGCTETGTSISGESGDDYVSSRPLYYNVKPLKSGRISIGLYTDEQCITEYPADTDTIEDIVGNIFTSREYSQHSSEDGNDNYDFSGDSLADSMDRWDSAFDVWHMCHPCVAYDIENTEGDKYLDDDDDYAAYDDAYYNRRAGRKRKLGGEYSAQGDVFECYDDAGYTNVNQCMKFSAKTRMQTATFRDLSLGKHQGTLAEYPLSGYVDARKEYHSKTRGYVVTYSFLFLSSCAFCFSLWNLYKVAKNSRRRGDDVSSQDALIDDTPNLT